MKLSPSHQARETIKQMLSIIDTANIDELLAPLYQELFFEEDVDTKEELKFDEFRIIFEAHEAVDALIVLALLGNRRAIQKLFFISVNSIRALDNLGDFESTIPDQAASSTSIPQPDPPKENKSPEDSTSTGRGDPIENDTRSHDVIESINESAEILLKLLHGDDQGPTRQVLRVLDDLPSSFFSFPLNSLLSSEPANPRVQLVSNLCDAMIQCRLDRLCGEITRELAGSVLCWPVEVSAQEYKTNQKITKIAPNLDIGELTIPPSSKTPMSGGPTEFARFCFRVLDKERITPRSEPRLDKLRNEEELDKRNIESLIDTAKKAKSESAASTFPEYRYERTIKNIWQWKAALLPELQLQTITINLWVDAAYAYLAANRDWSPPPKPWPNFIEAHIERTHSEPAGVRRALREGFLTLATLKEKPTRPRI